jgi:hypothetical protein
MIAIAIIHLSQRRIGDKGWLWANSGEFNNALSWLRTLELVEGRGGAPRKQQSIRTRLIEPISAS